MLFSIAKALKSPHRIPRRQYTAAKYCSLVVEKDKKPLCTLLLKKNRRHDGSPTNHRDGWRRFRGLDSSGHHWTNTGSSKPRPNDCRPGLITYSNLFYWLFFTNADQCFNAFFKPKTKDCVSCSGQYHATPTLIFSRSFYLWGSGSNVTLIFRQSFYLRASGSNVQS